MTDIPTEEAHDLGSPWTREKLTLLRVHVDFLTANIAAQKIILSLIARIEELEMSDGVGSVIRMYPESKSGLIKWIEDHFHEIDEYLAIFTLKDGTDMTVYDCCSYRSALGMCAMQTDTIQKIEDFKPKMV